MIKPFRGTDGAQYAHNFKNTYLSEAELQKPSKEVSEQIAIHTKKQIDQLVFSKQCATMGQLRASDGAAQQYIKYTPKQGDSQQTGQERIVKVQAQQLDPMEPPRFKHKRIPKGPGSPPPIQMRSPPRKLTLKDQQDWKIPPCISNWKNAKGYTIPLEMRLSADGRTLQHHTVNAKFAQLTDGLYIAERQSRKELEERNKILKSMQYKEYQEKEEENRQKAMEARQRKNLLLEQTTKQEEVSENLQQQELQAREELRYLRKRELERQLRQENQGKKSKLNRDNDRDISEKIALGQAQPTTQNTLYDQRLFNQTQGVNHGFGDEDEYEAFDKPLFNEKPRANLYTGIQQGEEDNNNKSIRNVPVQFEKADNIFGMDSFIADPVVKKVKLD
ncbi:unnamed protein product [Paramecium primaurelia]|uniref:SKI-interacting protein SKIP SNW domain-containing protein n=1 Tax=Paramecium primaurelia TaxID=5886 RepID=A0A8S1L6E0_PARPR|nr:unnamed protein product [Paramecium primaurelia]